MAEINGVVIGVVVDTRDPSRQRRIRVRLPSIDQAITEWTRVAIGSGGLASAVPQVDDEVLVAFEHGDMRRPIVIGALWKGTSPPQQLQLPTGSALYSIAPHEGSPCAATFSVLQQTAPWLASIDCVLRILRLLQPLIDVVNGLPSPSRAALQKFAIAATDLAPCLLTATAGPALAFVRDLVCLVLRALRCLLEDSGRQIVTTQAVVPIQAILDAAAPFFAAAGVQPLQLAAVSDIQKLSDDIARLQVVADGLGGCPDS